MNRNRVPIIIISLIAFIILISGFWSLGQKIVRINLSRGETSQIIENTGRRIFRINGEWLSAWSPDGPETLPRDPAKINNVSQGLSGIWNDNRAGVFSPSTGSAVYRIMVKTSGRRGLQALRFSPLYSAWEVYINGEKVFDQGTAGGSYQDETASSLPGIVAFEQKTDDIEIILKVSNFHHYTGGSLLFGIEYGKLNDILDVKQFVRNIFLIIFFIFLFYAGYCGIKSFFYKEEKYHLYLGLLLFLLMGRVFLGDILCMITAETIKSLPFEISRRLALVAGLTGIWAVFRFSLIYLNLDSNKIKLMVAPSVVLGAGVLVSAFIPGRLFSYMEPLEVLFVLAGAGYLLVLGIMGIRRKTEFARLFTAAISVFLIFGIFYSLNYLGIKEFKILLISGAFLSILLFGIVLAVKEYRFQTRTVNIENKLTEVTHSRNNILLSLSDEVGETLDKVSGLVKTLIQGSLGPLNSDQLVTVSLVLANNLMHQNLLNDTIDLVRLGENELKIKKDSVNLFSLVSFTLGSLQPVALGLSLKMKNEVPRDLPNVWADEKRVGQILFTFFSFAVENASDGEITVKAEKIDEEILLEVEVEGLDDDNSLEAVEEVLASDQGFVYHSREDFSGLRFYLSRQLVFHHGGKLELERTGDSSVMFSFRIPVSKALEVEDVVSEELAIHLDAIQNLQPLLDEVESERDITILAAAGDGGNLQIIKSQLASMNYHIHPVVTGEELLESISREVPDMVVIDSSLKDHSCFDMCRAIRKEFNQDELPVLLMIQDASEVMESLTSGASDYLRKPYQQEEFLTRVSTHLQLSKINSVYSQFVPREFLKALGHENIIDLKLGDQVQREMTILFVDIRAFTNLSENMTPQENFKFINSYLSQFTPIITRNNGFVDKFIGDAIMALYPDKPEDAIRTAIEMTEYVKIYNGYRANCGYNPINIGIGIHTGNMILGIVGDQRRMQGTVISDAVNLASRIQDVTKLYKSNVVISQETFVKLDNPMEFNFRFLGKVKVKGKDKSVSLFEIFNSDKEEIKKLKEETKSEFETAILLFAKRDFPAAVELFEKVLAVYPDDQTAQLFLDRANKFLSSEKKSFLTSL